MTPADASSLVPAALTPREYFELHRAEAESYVAVTLVRAVKAGEVFIRKFGPLKSASKAPRDGYVAYTSFEGSDYDGFMTGQKVIETTYDIEASGAALVTPREDIPSGTTIELMARNEKAVVGSKTIQAGVDGALVTLPGKEREFYSNHDLTSVFNYAGARKITTEQYAVVFHGSAPMSGVLVRAPLALMVEDKSHIVGAGSLIVEVKDEGGIYHGVLPARFARSALRREPENFIAPRLTPVAQP